MKMRVIFYFTALIMVTACGDTEQTAPNVPQERPTSYYVRKVDLYRETPNDICRAADREYLQKLIGQIQRELQFKATWADFEDFSVVDSSDGKHKEAIVRFYGSIAGHPDQLMMFATGPFNERGCKVRDLKFGTGSGPYDPETKPLL